MLSQQQKTRLQTLVDAIKQNSNGVNMENHGCNAEFNQFTFTFNGNLQAYHQEARNISEELKNRLQIAYNIPKYSMAYNYPPGLPNLSDFVPRILRAIRRRI